MVGTIGKGLLFPHRDFSFDTIHSVGTGLEGRLSMGSCDRNDDAALTNFKASDTMHHGNLTDGKFLLHLSTDLGQLLFCHRSIRFVLQVADRATVKIIAYDAIKGHNGAVCGAFDQVIHLLHAQGFCRDAKHQAPPLTGGMSTSSSPSAKVVSGSTKSICKEKRVLAIKGSSVGYWHTSVANACVTVAPASTSSGMVSVPAFSRMSANNLTVICMMASLHRHCNPLQLFG